MYRECWNKFLCVFLPLFFFTGAKYWDLATVTCNLYLFTDTLLYYIYGSWLHLTSLHLAEILGGIFEFSMTFSSLPSLLGIVAYRYQYSTARLLCLTNSIHPPSLLITPISFPITRYVAIPFIQEPIP